MVDKLAIENAVTSILGGRLSYRDNKKFSDEQVEELKKAIVAAIEAYDRQIREQEPPQVLKR